MWWAYAGSFPFAMVGFDGIGADTLARLTIAHWPFWFALPIAGRSVGLPGFLIGFRSAQDQGDLFFHHHPFLGVLIAMVLNNWISLTNGPDGLSGIKSPESIPLFNGAAMLF